MTNKIYFIQLRPLHAFFFGGMTTFGAGETANYLAQSRYFPQQTAIIGMLRYQLLAQNDLLSNQGIKSGATALIGEKSFDAAAKEEQNFGAIKKISPLWIYANTDRLLIEPLTKNLCLEANEKARTLYNNGKQQGQGMLLKPTEGGNEKWYKNGLNEGFVSSENSAIRYDFEGTTPSATGEKSEEKPYIFKAQQKVGIQKGEKGNTETKAFYKQTVYQFNKIRDKNKGDMDFSFGFYVELKPNEKGDFPKLADAKVYLGGERSIFEMTVSEKPSYPADFPMPKGVLTGDEFYKVILLNNAYLPREIYDKCLFAVTNTAPFKNLQSSLKATKRYYNLDESKESLSKAKETYTLVKRGSVFYCAEAEDANSLKSSIEAFTNFHNIGYNYATIVKPS